MGYTKEQIAKLGVRPRVRKAKKDGTAGLLPCEERECAAVCKALSEDSDELWQYFRMIPFEEGYACQRRKEFEKWLKDEIENMWWDIGCPVFDEDGNWSCPEGGWWPYLEKPYLDISYLRVGTVLIDMDEIYTTLRHMIEEKIHGYRMCPGMMLYRVMHRIIKIDQLLEEDSATKPKNWRKNLLDEKCKLQNQVVDLVRDYPTDVTRNVEDRVYYGYN